MTLLSRVSGLLRDIVLAQSVGATLLADAFFMAFRIPNFFRRIFAEGAFSVAFVPVLVEFRANRRETEARAFIDTMAGRLGLVLLILTVIGIAFAPAITGIVAPGFRDDPVKFAATVDALRFTFPYLFFISMVAMAAGVFNSYGRFAVPAVTPVWLNLCLIFAALMWIPVFPNAAVALAAGVLLAGIIQLAFQVPFLRRDAVLPRPRLGFGATTEAGAGREGSSRVFRLMAPAVFGTSVAQINLLVNTVLASFLVTGSVSWLYYSDRLIEFPVGVFGVALGTVMLPKLSEHHVAESMQRFSELLDWGLRFTALIATPAMVGLIVLAKPLLITMFQYRAFTPHDVDMASRSLVAFALGLIGFVMVRVLAPGFYARQDTRTPVRVGLIALIVNIPLCAVLVWPLGHVGLALAPSIAAIANAMLLLRTLRRTDLYRPMPGWGALLLRVAVASTAMAAVLWWGAGDASQWSADSVMVRVGRLVLWVSVGAAVYFLGILSLGLRPRHLRLQEL